MNKLFSLACAAVAVTMANADASAQVVTGPIITSYRPITEQAPTVTYSPVIQAAPMTTTGPVVAYSPVLPQTTALYSQAPITVARPIVQPATTYAPVAPAPVVTYRPMSPAVVARAPVVTYRAIAPAYSAAPAPVVTYRQPVPGYAAPAAVVTYRRPMTFGAPVATAYGVPVVMARPVIVSPKVYVPGQPLRNVLRAITP